MTNFSIVRLPSNLVITIDNQKQIVCKGCDDETFQRVTEAKNVEELAELLPDVKEMLHTISEAELFNKRVAASQYLTRKGQSVYWRSISELSMPQDLVEKVLEAEESKDYDALEAYHNFWTLMSLNPDSRVRQNLFWFLNIWGMQISRTGLFVGYRNVDIAIKGENLIFSQSLCDWTKEQWEKIKSQKKSPKNYWVEVLSMDNYYLINGNTRTYEELKDAEDINLFNLNTLYEEFKGVNFVAKNCGDDTIYTDHHSHKFKIKIGEIVSMPREECDCSCDNECSRGLHLSRPGWLTYGYFGEQGLVCLCNPAKVVSVPYDSEYGKLRTCEYLPIALCEYDETGNVIPYNVDNGFESRFVKTLLYDGAKSTEECPAYVMNAADIPEVNKSAITESIYRMAENFINK